MNMSISDKTELSEDNLELIQKFTRDLLKKRVPESIVIKCSVYLGIVSEKMEKNFLKVTKEDITSFLSEMRGSNCPFSTKENCIVILDIFFSFLEKEKILRDMKKTMKSTTAIGEIIEGTAKVATNLLIDSIIAASNSTILGFFSSIYNIISLYKNLPSANEIGPLVETLVDENKAVLQVATKVLREVEDQKTVEPLLDALKGRSWYIKGIVAKALGQIGGTAIESLIRVLKDRNWDVRRAAAEILGEMRDPRATEPLVDALKDKDWDVRRAAAEILGEMRDPRATEPLADALKDKNWGVRRAAAEALGKIGDPRATEPLINALKSEDWYIKGVVAKTLGKIGGTAIESLIRVLKDRDWRVRFFAAKALGEIGDPRATEPLVDALKDRNREVRRIVAEILRDIENKS